MSKDLEYYLERMGYMPCYKFPEEVGENEEFKFYEFKVPRHYIREHIAEGNIWPNYVETTEAGTEDNSVVLGVGFFPVFSGVDFLGEDPDFLYYRVKVPKVFLETQVEGTTHTYSILYETKDFKLKTPEEIAEKAAETISCAKAGEPMPNKMELSIVRKVKEADVLLYEVVLRCNSCTPPVTFSPDVGSDLWDLLHERECELCGNRALQLVSCKSVLEEKKDE